MFLPIKILHCFIRCKLKHSVISLSSLRN